MDNLRDPVTAPDDGTPTAEDLFADFIEGADEGRVVFEDFVALHPEHADALTRMHRRFHAMSTAFSVLAGEASEPARPSPSMDALMGRIGAGAGRPWRYAVGAEIARGAMGRIVNAWDGDLGREVALKILRGSDSDARRHRRFLEEAQIAGQLDHPGIVPIHELGVDPDGRPFFAMKLVRGQHLGEVIRAAQEERDGWSRTRALHVLLRVCEAIAYAHDRGVVHRDLKPENVMVGRFGETYVMDWGLATVANADAASEDALRTLRTEIAEEDSTSPLLTRHGDVVGTPAYMAPEQATGSAGAIPTAVDVYALGAILYHLCAGRMPYAADGVVTTADDILARVKHGAPEPLPSDVPAELRAIQERAMARDPQERYPSVEALADDLRAFLELRVVKAYATGRFAELRKWMVRNRGISIASTFALIALLVGIAVSTEAFFRAEQNARKLAVELERSEFRNARLLSRSDNAASAEDRLWRQHLAGTMPRATLWALAELYERTPCAVAVSTPTRGNVPIRFVPGRGEVVVGSDDGGVHVLDDRRLKPMARIEVGTSAVQSLAVIPGSSTLWVGLADGSVVVVDLAARRVLRGSKPHGSEVRAIAIRADEGLVATGGGDGRVLLWSADSAEPREIVTHKDPIWSLCFDRDGRKLASGDRLGGLNITAVAGGEPQHWQLGKRNIMAIALLDDGTRLWAGSADQNIYLLDTLGREPLRSIWTRNGTCRDIVEDVDGTLIVGGWWRIDRFAKDGTPLHPVGLNGTWRFDLDRASRRLVSAGDRNAVRLFDLAEGWDQVLGGMNVAMSGDGSRIAFDREDRIVVRSIDQPETEPEVVVPRFGGWLALDHDGQRLAALANTKRGLEVYDLGGDVTQPSFVVRDASAPYTNESFGFSPDGKELATFVGPGRLRRINARDGSKIAEHDQDGADWIRLRYLRDGSALAVVSLKPARLRLIHLSDGRIEDFPLPLHPTAAALSPDGTTIACADRDGHIQLVDRVSGVARSIGSQSGTVWSLDFSPVDSGLLMVSTRADGVMLFDLDNGEICHRWTVDDGPITQLQFSDDGMRLAAYSQRGALIRRFDVMLGNVAGNLDFQIERLRASTPIDPTRERELRGWAERCIAALRSR